MSNMSYCRFHNTLQDVKECLEAIEGGDLDEADEDEKRAAKSMFKLILNYCLENEIIESWCEFGLNDLLSIEVSQ